MVDQPEEELTSPDARMNKSTFRSLLAHAGDALWFLALVGLPIISFPYYARVANIQMLVTPFSMLPLAILALLWFIPYVFRHGKSPIETTPIFFFVMAAVVSSAAIFFFEIPTFKGRSILGQELRIFLTLGVGLLFYLLTATYPRDEEKLQKTLRWITIGGAVLIGWTLLQAYFIIVHDVDYPRWFITIRDALVYQRYQSQVSIRTSGLAYESSWFTHMLVILYLPLWIASAVQHTSSFKVRLFKVITVEHVLLFFGMIVFMLASPRISLVALMLIALFFFVKIILRLYQRIIRGIEQKRIQPIRHPRLLRTGIGALLVIGVLAISLGAGIGLLKLGSTRDWRLELIFTNPPQPEEILKVLTLDDNTLIDLSNRFAFMERTIYWVTGANVFNDYPLLGVGLGNSGFFALQKVPHQAFYSYEIRDALFRAVTLMNTKNIWTRLLSETGLVGFGIFAAWLWVAWRSAATTLKSRSVTLRWVASMGQLALVAYLAEGFSIDSFAMPYLWVFMGLIASAGMISRKVDAPSTIPVDK